eukprot:605245-Pelagomonas_calceolata.AAC.2
MTSQKSEKNRMKDDFKIALLNIGTARRAAAWVLHASSQLGLRQLQFLITFKFHGIKTSTSSRNSETSMRKLSLAVFSFGLAMDEMRGKD